MDSFQVYRGNDSCFVRFYIPSLIALTKGKQDKGLRSSRVQRSLSWMMLILAITIGNIYLLLVHSQMVMVDF